MATSEKSSTDPSRRGEFSGQSKGMVEGYRPPMTYREPLQQRAICYRDSEGKPLMIETEKRVKVRDRSRSTMDSAVMLASLKFKGQIRVTGGENFQRLAAAAAARQGLSPDRFKGQDMQGLVKQARWDLRKERSVNLVRSAPGRAGRGLASLAKFVGCLIRREGANARGSRANRPVQPTRPASAVAGRVEEKQLTQAQRAFQRQQDRAQKSEQEKRPEPMPRREQVKQQDQDYAPSR